MVSIAARAMHLHSAAKISLLFHSKEKTRIVFNSLLDAARVRRRLDPGRLRNCGLGGFNEAYKLLAGA
jgi:hypothetical protein